MPLPLPIGRQREVLYLPAEGHVAVLGTAGSGKTTLAILRSAYLSDPSTAHTGPTLLVTFNRALVVYLRHLASPQLRNVQVENYHVFARGYLGWRRKMQNDCICTPELREQLIEEAVLEVAGGLKDHPITAYSSHFYSNVVRWTYQLGYVTEKDVMLGLVSGSYGLNEEIAGLVLAVRRAYEARRKSAGKLYDWDDIAIAVDQEMAVDDSERMYTHVVIDEGQDFSPVMIHSLTRAAGKDGSVTFFGDVAQQIYGSRFSWRSAGLKVTKPWLFEENYRNTKQIADLALALTKQPFYRGLADLVTPRSPRAAGPLPALVRCADTNREIDFVLRAAKSAARTGTAAILVRNREDERLFTSSLREKDYIRLYRDMNIWQPDTGLYIGTYHGAKGLEFDSVFMPRLSRDRIPDPATVEADGHEIADSAEAKLLYVGITRARQTLVLCHTGIVTDLLPSENALYQKSTT